MQYHLTLMHLISVSYLLLWHTLVVISHMSISHVFPFKVLTVHVIYHIERRNQYYSWYSLEVMVQNHTKTPT